MLALLINRGFSPNTFIKEYNKWAQMQSWEVAMWKTLTKSCGGIWWILCISKCRIDKQARNMEFAFIRVDNWVRERYLRAKGVAKNNREVPRYWHKQTLRLPTFVCRLRRMQINYNYYVEVCLKFTNQRLLTLLLDDSLALTLSKKNFRFNRSTHEWGDKKFCDI